MNRKDLIDQLTKHEGVELMPYKDTEGLLTIGIGRCLDRIGISQDEAEYMLANDINNTQRALFEACPWMEDLDPVRQYAFVNMAFNIWVAGLLKFNNTLSYAKQGRWEECAFEALDSKWARQVGKRSAEIAEQLRTGVYAP